MITQLLVRVQPGGSRPSSSLSDLAWTESVVMGTSVAASTELSDHSINTWRPGREGRLSVKPVRGKWRGGGGGGGDTAVALTPHAVYLLTLTEISKVTGGGWGGEGGSIIQHRSVFGVPTCPVRPMAHISTTAVTDHTCWYSQQFNHGGELRPDIGRPSCSYQVSSVWQSSTVTDTSQAARQRWVPCDSVYGWLLEEEELRRLSWQEGVANQECPGLRFWWLARVRHNIMFYSIMVLLAGNETVYDWLRP